jgi:hypothetical protein
VVSKEEFGHCCVPPKVEVSGHTNGNPWFNVHRTVVDEKDYGVYALTETVGPDGRVTVGAKRLLSRDGRRLGRFLDPNAE